MIKRITLTNEAEHFSKHVIIMLAARVLDYSLPPACEQRRSGRGVGGGKGGVGGV